MSSSSKPMRREHMEPARRTRVELVAAVIAVVRLIPEGRVLTYGDIAEIIGTGPRQVGWAMAHGSGEVPWWRVVNATGAFPVQHHATALAHHLEEGTALSQDRTRIRLAKARLNPEEWVELTDSADIANLLYDERIL